MRYFNTPKARIEIIPMIDIMFFLLVFFIMITLRMIPDAGMATQLPQSSTATQLPHPKLTVTLKSDGTVLVHGKPITLAALTAQLAAHDPSHTDVTIAGAKSVSLQHLMDVMDACRHAGVTDLGIAAREAP
ncbi:MAG TPA: biopolymer transporter ExbD [Gammaproteobacteria bacterium]|nr:biopolymer transporter ExbD [Gammaproteobacteria bacterium]